MAVRALRTGIVLKRTVSGQKDETTLEEERAGTFITVVQSLYDRSYKTIALILGRAPFIFDYCSQPTWHRVLQGRRILICWFITNRTQLAKEFIQIRWISAMLAYLPIQYCPYVFNRF